MKKSILACLADFDESVLSAAVHFAKMFDSSITLLYALEPLCDLLPDFASSCSPAIQQSLLARFNDEQLLKERHNSAEAQAMLARCKERCKADGVEASVLTLGGDLDECVAQIERDYLLNIVRKTSDEHSHVYDLLRASSIPLMLAPQEFRAPKTVLFAYDGSEALDAALRRSLCAPLFAGCERICLHMNKDAGRAKAVLARARELFDAHNVQVRCEHAQPMSANELIAYAQAANADVIGMGAYSSNAFKRFFVGSFTNEMIEKSPLGLFIFR